LTDRYVATPDGLKFRIWDNQKKAYMKIGEFPISYMREETARQKAQELNKFERSYPGGFNGRKK